ncbi:lipocalin-like domain-containing protein [Streptomyces sp. NPDC058371]|uniref:lipocalin-like domain-containing protein n=1 Tax=Streptomyces sp. NPDC058371 TaxID=3346463 RepID=UPI00365832FB
MTPHIHTNVPAIGDKVTVDGKTFTFAEMRSVVDIDRDLPEHDGRWPNESWFVVANLDSGGQRMGLQVHFLVQRLPGGATDIVQLNVVVVNESTGVARAAEYIHPLDQVEIGTDRLNLVTPELTWTGDRNGYTMSVKADVAQIDITATSSGPPLLMNGQGQVRFLGLDEQYDFAFPAMNTSGTVVLDSQPYDVTGISWLDRQWGGLPDFFAESLGKSPEAAAAGAGAEPPASPMNWMWICPQLDNGVNISLAQLRDMVNQEIFLTLTAVHPDGTHVVAPTMLPVEATNHWTSPVTGRSYPTRCVVRAPQIGTELIIEVPCKEQEIVSKEPSLTKYEGAATVTGTYQGEPVTGHAYLELVGDWS